MIRVLIADDSAVLRQSIRLVLESDDEIQVVGEAGNGVDAVSFAAQLHPDLVTMDLAMPRMDGLQAIDKIMADHPVPIVVVTSVDPDLDHLVAQAPKHGAVAVLRRPTGIASPEYRMFANRLIEQVKIMSAVKVIPRSRANGGLGARAALAGHPAAPAARRSEVVAIGSSTGGPAALHRVLSALPATLDAPILIVQHITSGFIEGLAAWLDSACSIRVRVSKQGERLEAGVAYVAPDGCHLTVDRSGKALLTTEPPVGGFRPSVNLLFESVARYYGPAAAGVLLTGMGADGATGMCALHHAGAATIAQDEATCVVFGMPKEAIALGAVQHVVPLDRIAPMIANLCTMPAQA